MIKKFILLFLIILFIFMFLLFTNTFKLSIDISSYINFDQEPCLKIDNCCKEDIDCSYI